MNVVFIVSDTLRRDHLGCYGNKEIRTPNIDRLAEKSIVFDNAYCGSFPTMPYRADIFTGRWTFTYLPWGDLPRNEITLAQCLTNVGYITKAVVNTPFFMRSGVIGINGYDKGFLDFECIHGQEIFEINKRMRYLDFPYQGRYEIEYITPRTMLAAEKWLETNYNRHEKFFLYVDTWDPHEDWTPPMYYSELYYPGFEEEVANMSDRKKRQLFCYPPYDFWRERGLTEEELKLAHAAYCGEITMVDRWIGYLLDGIENMGLMDDTVIIFTSDHGFYFGEHGIFGKHLSPRKFSPLYEEIIHLPLLMYVPGLKSRRSKALVSSPDIVSTILELAGIEIPSSVHGKSLVPVLEGQDCKGRDFTVSSWPLFDPSHHPSTITSNDGWTLIYGTENVPAELYNLTSDPHQEKNLIQDRKDIAQNLLDKFISRLRKAGTAKSLES